MFFYFCFCWRFEMFFALSFFFLVFFVVIVAWVGVLVDCEKIEAWSEGVNPPLAFLFLFCFSFVFVATQQKKKETLVSFLSFPQILFFFFFARHLSDLNRQFSHFSCVLSTFASTPSLSFALTHCVFFPLFGMPTRTGPLRHRVYRADCAWCC